MINELLEMLFSWNSNANSRDRAKSRLKVIIAHDRAGINPEMMNSMREEILDVVARYVEVDLDEMEFSLSNDQRFTALTANLPIRQVKRLANSTKTVNAKSNESEPQELKSTEIDGDIHSSSAD